MALADEDTATDTFRQAAKARGVRFRSGFGEREADELFRKPSHNGAAGRIQPCSGSFSSLCCRWDSRRRARPRRRCERQTSQPVRTSSRREPLLSGWVRDLMIAVLPFCPRPWACSGAESSVRERNGKAGSARAPDDEYSFILLVVGRCTGYRLFEPSLRCLCDCPCRSRGGEPTTSALARPASLEPSESQLSSVFASRVVCC